jgi:hypothetical protein
VTADFRLSSTVNFPYAENPHLCGVPGKFVQLPLSFFYTANSNDFGPICNYYGKRIFITFIVRLGTFFGID